MIREAALITLSCVLFVQMGLSEAIQDAIRVHVKIPSCPKCLSFWSVLAYLVLNGYGITESVAVSFLSSYCALWLSLLYDALARLYNYCYEAISETRAAEDAEAADPDAVPKM